MRREMTVGTPGTLPPASPRRLTVVFVDQGLSFGGSYVVVANLARALDPSRFRMILVGAADRTFLEYRFGGFAEIRHIRHGIDYAAWARINRLAERLPRGIVRKLFLRTLMTGKIAINSVYVIKLLALFLRERVDIIHLNNGLGNLEAFLGAVLSRRPAVVHVHGIDQLSRLPRYVLRRSKRLVAISEFVAERIRSYGVPAERIHCLHNPVLVEQTPPTAREAVREKYGIPVDAPVVAIFGRVVRWKGQLEFLRAAKVVLEHVPTARVAIVGDEADRFDDYGTAIRALVEQSGLRDRVIFTGFVEDVASMYAAMDVVVHASIEPEPFGLVITEAMSHGIPVLASTLGAPREIIRDGVTGFLVHPEDTTRLAATIESLLSDPALRQRIGEAGRAHVLETYSLARYAKAMEALYLDAAACDASPP